MLAHLAPSSGAIFAMLSGCLVLVLLFEGTNGFHDTANAVATVIYTHALKPVQAVVWSGLLNFAGVMAGGIAVAYTLVDILPPDVLTPPDGAPAVPMLVAIFTSALFWNVLTWGFGIPNSSSHCVVGALVGVAVGDSLLQSRALGQGVDWPQVWNVLRSLAVSPVLGFIGAGGLYGLLRLTVRTGRLFEPPKQGEPPVWWLRGLLVLTCSAVSVAHGTNDGQKSIGLIMLTIIGLMPAAYALNPAAPGALDTLGQRAAQAAPLIERYGDEEKGRALRAAKALETAGTGEVAGAAMGRNAKTGLRGDIYEVLGQLKTITALKEASAEDKARAGALHDAMSPPVQYAPVWVRVLSAVCLGVGTTIGYKRVVRTLGERLGGGRMTPGQGASAELVGSVLISTAGFTGLPVSTTHIITSGITGTMVTGGQGVQGGMLLRIALAWVFTLPVTGALSAGLFYLLDDPRF